MIKQVYAPYTQWEDWQNGMYRTVSKREFQRLKDVAKDLLCNPPRLEAEMNRAVTNWTTSAAVNLTDKTANHRPWLGQSACCIAYGCTEDATRAAWSELSIEQQREANMRADTVYKTYLEQQDTKRQLWLNLEWL